MYRRFRTKSFLSVLTWGGRMKIALIHLRQCYLLPGYRYSVTIVLTSQIFLATLPR